MKDYLQYISNLISQPLKNFYNSISKFREEIEIYYVQKLLPLITKYIRKIDSYLDFLLTKITRTNLKIILESIVLILASLTTSILTYAVSIIYLPNTDSTWMAFLTSTYQFGDRIYLTSHTSILKLPIVFITTSIWGNSIIANLIAINFTMLLSIMIIYFVSEKVNSSQSFAAKIIRILIITLLMNSSSEYFMFSGLISSRNLEYSFLLILFFLIAKYIFSQKLRIRYYILIIIISFLLAMSDELMTILIFAPLAIFWMHDIYINKKLNIKFIKYTIPSLIGIFLATFLLKTDALQSFNIYIIDYGQFFFTIQSQSITSFKNIYFTIISLFGIDFSGKPISIQSVASLITFAFGIICFGKLLIYGLRFKTNLKIFNNSKNIFLHLVCFAIFANLAIFYLSNLSSFGGNGRFLSFILVGTCIFVSTYYNFTNLSRYLKLYLSVVLIAFIFINSSFIFKYFSENQPNFTFYDELDKIIAKHDLQVGAGGFWNSYSISTISERHIPVVPIKDCTPQILINNKRVQNLKPDFLIVDRSNQYEDKEFWKGCNNQDIKDIYGEPKNIYSLYKNNHLIEIYVLK